MMAWRSLGASLIGRPCRAWLAVCGAASVCHVLVSVVEGRACSGGQCRHDVVLSCHVVLVLGRPALPSLAPHGMRALGRPRGF